MKKKMFLFSTFLLALLSFTSCFGPIAVYNTKDSDEVEFERTVLYSEETPSEDLVWRITLFSPRPDTYKDKDTKYYTFDAEISNHGIAKLEQDKTDYKKKFLRTIGMTEWWFEKKYDVDLREGSVTAQNCYIFKDRTIFILNMKTGEEIVEGPSVGRRNRVIIVDKHRGKVYINYYDEPYTQEEYQKTTERYGVDGFYERCNRHSNIFYLKFRYYDMETHTIGYYTKDTEQDGVLKSIDAYEYLCADTNFAPYFSKEYFEWYSDVPYNIICSTVIANKQYTLLSTQRKNYEYDLQDGTRSFAGNEVYYAMFDLDTGSLLYLEKIHLKNYSTDEIELSKAGGLYKKIDSEMYSPYFE